ncbi:ABC transport system permease protein [Clostridium aceticum]|uniref:ABC transport system permease protein n=1 Tax=Clostridium aceticum TaxID=84022 RepID=A0A0D8I9E3_9CLOT|nr:FtsX-like permease family protein [Clostridium aceticum]AKL96301.1 ABC transport system permease protein [Clostridium aceticum]KJF26900.1 ABC-type antimicrobial peptide transport system, permease component [Clostridium aceticum]
MKKLDVRLFRLIKNSKGQFISTALMIILALTIYVSFSMVADNLYNTIYHYYDITNFGDVFIEVVRVPKSAIDQLHTIEGVEMAQGRISSDVPLRVENPEEKVRVRIVSLPQESQPINGLYTIEGRDLQGESKAAVMLQQFSDARGIMLEDRIVPYIAGREYPLDVVGIVGSPEYIYLMENEQTLMPAAEKFGVIYVTEDFAQSVLGYQGSYNEVMIKIDQQYIHRIDSIVDEIEDQLDRYGVRRTIKREDQLSHRMMMEEVDQLETMATAITLLFLIVAAVIINIILSRTVKNDRMSIGVMKALGYSNFSILGHYTKFSLLMGLVGSVIGILLSLPLSQAFTNLYIMYMNIPMFQMEVYYIYFFYGILLTSGFCVVSGLMGARSVLKILPADSMRPEAPKTGGRIWLEKVKFIWNNISFSWKMVIRNILRNKRRAAFLVVGIALTYAITMVPIFMSSVWTNIFTLQYGKFQTMDYNIDFAHPMSSHVLRELSQVIEIDHIEPKTEIPFELRNGWRKKAVSIVGLPRDTRFYHFESPGGYPVVLPSNGIILAERLAEALDVTVGDEIFIKNFMPDQEDKFVEVKGIVEQYLGTNAYMDIEAVNNLLGEKGVVTGALLDSKDEVVLKLQNVKNIRQVQSVEDMKNSFLEFMDMIIYSVGVLMLFGGILGFAIVYNITIISINERLMEFSSLRVMGFDKKEIYKMISRENTLMTFIGILVGIPVGYGMCAGIVSALSTDLFSIPLIINPSSYFFTAMATIVFVVIAQLATMRKIYRLNFMEALKNRIS